MRLQPVDILHVPGTHITVKGGLLLMGEPERAICPFTLESLTFLQLSQDPRIDARLLTVEVRETVEYMLDYVLSRAFWFEMNRIKQYAKAPEFEHTDELGGEWNFQFWYGNRIAGTRGQPCLFFSPQGHLFSYRCAPSSGLWVCSISEDAWEHFPLKEVLAELEDRCVAVSQQSLSLLKEGQSDVREIMSWISD